MLFISLSCLVAVARIISTMLSRSGERAPLSCSCIPDPKWIPFKFLPLKKYYLGFVIYGLHYVEYILSIPVF